MKSTQQATKIYNSVDMYQAFRKKYPGSDINYRLFRYILSSYNKGIVSYVLSGSVFYLGANLGRIRIKRVKRNFSKPTVDWGATKKLAAEGIKKLVYFVDEYYYRFAWEKKYCNVTNKTAYSFRPAGGKNGPKKQLVKLLAEDDLAHLNFVQDGV